MSRRPLTDAQWVIIEPLLPGKAGDPGRTATDNRLFIDAVLWMARGAAPWRDLPPEPGTWRTVHCRFRGWSLRGILTRLFNALRRDPDFEYVLVGATICKARADASGAKGGLIPRRPDHQNPCEHRRSRPAAPVYGHPRPVGRLSAGTGADWGAFGCRSCHRRGCLRRRSLAGFHCERLGCRGADQAEPAPPGGSSD